MVDAAAAQQAGLNLCALVNLVHADDVPSIVNVEARKLIDEMDPEQRTLTLLVFAGYVHAVAHKSAYAVGWTFQQYMAHLAKIVVETSAQMPASEG